MERGEVSYAGSLRIVKVYKITCVSRRDGPYSRWFLDADAADRYYREAQAGGASRPRMVMALHDRDNDEYYPIGDAVKFDRKAVNKRG